MAMTERSPKEHLAESRGWCEAVVRCWISMAPEQAE